MMIRSLQGICVNRKQSPYSTFFFFAWRTCSLQPSNTGTMFRGGMRGVDPELDPEGILGVPSTGINCHLVWSAKMLTPFMGHLVGRYPAL